MIYLLDTNACIQLLNNKHPVILDHFRQHSPAEIILCSVVKAELLFGAQRSSRIEANLRRLNIFFEPLLSLSFDDACAASIMHRFAPICMREANSLAAMIC